jgi:hypothetical protein
MQGGPACCLFIEDQKLEFGEEIKPRRVQERLLEIKKMIASTVDKKSLSHLKVKLFV